MAIAYFGSRALNDVFRRKRQQNRQPVLASFPPDTKILELRSHSATLRHVEEAAHARERTWDEAGRLTVVDLDLDVRRRRAKP